MTIVTKKIADLKPAAYNPRKIDDLTMVKLRRSLEEFGFVEPLVVNKDMTVVGGHQRLKAAEAMGLTEVPCVMVDLPKPAEQALNLALNKISGDWDTDKLSALLEALDDRSRVLSGFEQREIEKALARAVEEQEGSGDTPASAETNICTKCGQPLPVKS